MEEKENFSKYEGNNEEESVKKQKNNLKKEIYKEKECKVIRYDKLKKTLDVMFDQYGIRIINVENFNGHTAILKYKGEIGKSNFEYIL